MFCSSQKLLKQSNQPQLQLFSHFSPKTLNFQSTLLDDLNNPKKYRKNQISLQSLHKKSPVQLDQFHIGLVFYNVYHDHGMWWLLVYYNVSFYHGSPFSLPLNTQVHHSKYCGCNNSTSFYSITKTMPETFETLIVILTIENINWWQSLLHDE